MNIPFSFEQNMRWYGPKDPVSLQHIAQAGCTGVVTALHHIPVGEIWPEDEIRFRREEINQNGLHWTVVESLPVHEDIKSKSGNHLQYIDNYKVSLRNLSACGIKVVTYNFMPVLDWLRTDVHHRLSHGGEALYFNKDAYEIFDLLMLKRPGVENDYTSERKARLETVFESMDEASRSNLYHNILLGLPGSDEPFTREEVLALLEKYRGINTHQLKDNLFAFLNEVAPVAEEAGIQLAIHPDDPPYSVLGLPRIMSTAKDVQDLMDAVPYKSSGLCFCTGSFGARQDNDLPSMLKKWGSRVYFFHLRNTKREENGNFMEANHLDGDTDMYTIVKLAVQLMNTEERRIPMRPDHGHKILDDLNKSTYPGYSAIGRLKGLAELRGLEYAILQQLDGK